MANLLSAVGILCTKIIGGDYLIKRVLTIDTDVIIGEDLSVYNNLIKMSSREKIWEEVYNLHPELKGNIKPDNIMIKRLLTFVEKTLAINPNVKINVTRNHDGVLTLLEPDIREGTKFSLINMDNHHDIWYSDSQFVETIKGRGGLANWVGYLYSQGVLEDYIWLKALRSPATIPDNFTGTCIITPVHKTLRNPIQNLDYLNLCWSPEWLPEELDWVFFKLKELIDKHLGYETEIDETLYNPDDKLKPLDIKHKPYSYGCKVIG